MPRFGVELRHRQFCIVGNFDGVKRTRQFPIGIETTDFSIRCSDQYRMILAEFDCKHSLVDGEFVQFSDFRVQVTFQLLLFVRAAISDTFCLYFFEFR